MKNLRLENPLQSMQALKNIDPHFADYGSRPSLQMASLTSWRGRGDHKCWSLIERGLFLWSKIPVQAWLWFSNPLRKGAGPSGCPGIILDVPPWVTIVSGNC
jgi:hypothetical protein